MVEDNPDDAFLAKEAVKEAKLYIELTIAEDGHEALAYLRQEGKYKDAKEPDLILLDLNLPKKSGKEVLAEIKTDDWLKKIPVVILTTSDAEEDIIQSYLLHANCYITKPLNLEEFIDVVRAIESFWFTIVKLPRQTEF